MTNISVTNPSISNSDTTDVSLLTQNFTDVINGLTDGTKDISVAAISATSIASGGTTLATLTSSAMTPAAGYLVLEGKSVDLVQVYNSGIADNDTDTLTFDFVPNKIVLNYSGVAKNYNTTFQEGMTTGNCVVTITGTNTCTVNNNYTSFFDNLGTPDTASGNDTTNAIYITGGTSTGTSSYVVGVATWVTATKILTITYQETQTTTASNAIQIMATAYK